MQYHRPASVAEAVTLLADDGAVVLGGGTDLVPRLARSPRPSAVVDLQALALDGIDGEGRALRLGAAVTLQALVDSDAVGAPLAALVRREAPRTVRNAATIAGVIASGESDSELLAALLVSGARVTLVTESGSSERSVADVLADGLPTHSLISEVSLGTNGQLEAARVARTPGDRPIVAAVARRRDDGEVRLALCGVAPTPVVVDPDHVASVDPHGDFKGSAAYRRSMAVTLAARVLGRLGQGA